MFQTLHIIETLNVLILHGGATGSPGDQGCQVAQPMCPSIKWRRILWVDNDLVLPVPYLQQLPPYNPVAKSEYCMLPSIPQKEQGPSALHWVPKLKIVHILSKALNSQEVGWSWENWTWYVSPRFIGMDSNVQKHLCITVGLINRLLRKGFLWKLWKFLFLLHHRCYFLCFYF